MADSTARCHRRPAACWLAAVIGVGLLLGAAYLYGAGYTAAGGTNCGSLAKMSETVNYTPPNDGGCSSAKDTRVMLFIVTGVAGLVLLVGGVGGALWVGRRSARAAGDDASRRSVAAAP